MATWLDGGSIDGESVPWIHYFNGRYCGQIKEWNERVWSGNAFPHPLTRLAERQMAGCFFHQ
jgi:hypothetical protein